MKKTDYISDEKVRQMLEAIKNRCQQFYSELLEVDLLQCNMIGPDFIAEYYIFPRETIRDKYLGKTVTNLLVEATLGLIPVTRRKIFSMYKGVRTFGVRGCVFDERVTSIVEEEVSNLKKMIPQLKVELDTNYQNF